MNVGCRTQTDKAKSIVVKNHIQEGAGNDAQSEGRYGHALPTTLGSNYDQ